MLAVRYAMDNGFNDFLLLGATGGRIDHQIANFNVAGFIAENGGKCEMLDENNRIYTIKNDKMKIKKEGEWSLSVFSHTEKSYGVNIDGVKYKLKDATLSSSFPLGISNEIEADYANIEVKVGTLLIVSSRLSR